MDLHTVCTQFFELRLDGPTAEPRPWSRVNVLEEHEDRAAGEYNVLDIVGHRYCLTGADHGHQWSILELAAVWRNGSMTWVAASALSHCAEALIEHGVRCGQRFSRQRGRLGQLRRTQSAQELGSPSEFHRRHVRTMEVLNATSLGHGCTALDRRYPRTYNEAYPGREPDAVEIARYRQWRRSMLESTSSFLPTVGQKCSVQAANAESDDETDRGQWRRPVREEASGEEDVQVADFVDDEAVDASDPPELERRRRMGWRYVELRPSEESETWSDTEEPSCSQRPRKRKARKHKKRRHDE
ncbi:hypothetical protein AAVH_14900 [Aphelenchoides avenae]|nr:hypothetical protein AAVH_39919 [Aphelenchus avenae]KAH7717621.1 hypothetical protein AAVH_14900 [Aphelenchus avenae]